MELQTQDAPTAARLSRADFELARAAGLQVNWPAESTFNNAVARFAQAVQAPLRTSMEEIDRLKLENAEPRQVRDAKSLLAQPAAPVIAAQPATKFCNQCGKVFAVAHADCRSHVPAEFAAPRCPQGHYEHWYCAGDGVQLVCHLNIDLGEPETAISPAVPASAELFAAYLHGTNIFDVLLTHEQVKDIEEDALREVQS